MDLQLEWGGGGPSGEGTGSLLRGRGRRDNGLHYRDLRDPRVLPVRTTRPLDKELSNFVRSGLQTLPSKVRGRRRGRSQREQRKGLMKNLHYCNTELQPLHWISIPLQLKIRIHTH